MGKSPKHHFDETGIFHIVDMNAEGTFKALCGQKNLAGQVERIEYLNEPPYGNICMRCLGRIDKKTKYEALYLDGKRLFKNTERIGFMECGWPMYGWPSGGCADSLEFFRWKKHMLRVMKDEE
jgi:hypothetical protein